MSEAVLKPASHTSCRRLWIYLRVPSSKAQKYRISVLETLASVDSGSRESRLAASSALRRNTDGGQAVPIELDSERVGLAADLTVLGEALAAAGGRVEVDLVRLAAIGAYEIDAVDEHVDEPRRQAGSAEAPARPGNPG